MHQVQKYILLSAALMLGISLFLGGCTAAKKPGNSKEKPPKAANSINAPNNTPTTRNQDYPKDIADRAVQEASQVAGVQSSSAVISGNTVYLGLNLQEGVAKNKSSEVEKNVLGRFNEPHYTLMVSTDPAMVSRIERVSQGIAQGKPISAYQEEIQYIGNRLKPRTQ